MFKSSPDYIETYYSATSADRQLHRPALTEDTTADVCIVGAGFFGMYCALEMARAGKKVVVLEASRVGWGASGRNGGQLVPGWACGMDALQASVGQSLAKNLFHETIQGLNQIKTLIEENGIDCDVRHGHIEVAVLERRVPLLSNYIEECEKLWGYDKYRFIKKTDLPNYVNSPRYQAGMLDEEAAHLHPLKYILALARLVEAQGVRIHEQSRVSGYAETADGMTVQLANGARVRCDQVVLAANAYLDRVDRKIASRVLPVGSFIGVTDVVGEDVCRSLMPKNHAVYDNQFVLEYFRTTVDHRLLFGGGCTYMGGEPADVRNMMKQTIVRTFPRLKDVDMAFGWGGHIDVTMRRMPDWGRRNDRVFWAQGFCGHGLVPTRVAATLVSEAMLGNTERLDAFAAIANPPFPGGEFLGGLSQAVGMAWYRLRDLF